VIGQVGVAECLEGRARERPQRNRRERRKTIGPHPAHREIEQDSSEGFSQD